MAREHPHRPATVAPHDGNGDPILTGEEEEDLVYASPDQPGMSRHRRGRGFSYHMADGRLVTDKKVLSRIRSLVIPPAWSDVWICLDPHGHIQATGRDVKGRRQYLYHPRWRAFREATKFGRLAAFGEALAHIRARAYGDIAQNGLSKDKVVATIVLLLDRTLMRIGNPEYTRSNDAYGLTTLRDWHATINDSNLQFRFRGKAGKLHSVGLHSRRLSSIVKRLQDLPGEELFQYVDEQGTLRPVESGDVNDYLRSIGGQEFSAKDFRTWGGTLVAAVELAHLGPFSSKTEGTRKLNQGIDAAARELGNTRTVARRSYIHPVVIESYLAGELPYLWPKLLEGRGRHCGPSERDHFLRPEEKALLALLKKKTPPAERAASGPALAAQPSIPVIPEPVAQLV